MNSRYTKVLTAFAATGAIAVPAVVQARAIWLRLAPAIVPERGPPRRRCCRSPSAAQR